MIEEYKESRDENTVKDLDKLKKDILTDGDEVLPDGDPVEELVDMFGHMSARFGISGNKLLVERYKQKNEVFNTGEFIKALCRYTHHNWHTGAPSVIINENLSPNSYNPWAKNVEDLEEANRTINKKWANLQDSADFEYMAKIIAWVIKKNKDKWCLSVGTVTITKKEIIDGKEVKINENFPALNVYDPTNASFTWWEFFNIILMDSELLKKFLIRVFDLTGKDTATGEEEATLNYLEELWFGKAPKKEKK